jgi:flagellar basal body rod protein FlgG
MNIGLYQSAAAMSSLERWQDAVSQNITSAQVTGFKRRAVQVSAQGGGELLINPNARADSGEGISMLFPQTRYAVSFSAGENNPTGRDLDFAISGPGFFSLRKPDGSLAYSRAGEFRIRNDRVLVNTQGLEVLNDRGDPIQLAARGEPPVIDDNGVIKQGDKIIGRFDIVAPERPERLVSLPGGLFYGDESVGMNPVEKAYVQQGYLEASNVAPLREMVDMVSISRAYEANQKLIQSRDKIMERTIETFS